MHFDDFQIRFHSLRDAICNKSEVPRVTNKWVDQEKKEDQ